ncbi:hypothetical protein [Vibrio agarivorans]|uniref:Spore coat protein U domain-containing protein n=1 Tax=Vibrio agarivorans TaxID=153622 RepID=A0ABT7Y1D2_9VIBR|nr:hypothetical protein [Vibrio agarivorans]MDN2481836.1 hypothetical protein [Vibrio agarivorans]
MKKLALAAAVSVLMAGQVYADPDFSGEPIDFELEAEVESTCYVSFFSSTLLNDTMNFGTPSVDDSLDGDITFKCNDPDGATLTMTSAQGGLTNIDLLTEKVKYEAKLTVGTASSTLVTAEGENESATLNVPASATLAGAGQSGNVLVTLKESATYAGEYLDTLTIQIAAN